MSLVCDLRTFKYSLLWEFRNNDTFPRDCLQQLYNLMPGKDQPHVRVQLTESSQCHCTMSILLLCYCLQAHSTSKVTIWCGRVFMPRPCSLFQQKTWHQTAAPGVVWDRHTNQPCCVLLRSSSWFECECPSTGSWAWTLTKFLPGCTVLNDWGTFSRWSLPGGDESLCVGQASRAIYSSLVPAWVLHFPDLLRCKQAVSHSWVHKQELSPAALSTRMDCIPSN